MQVSTAVLSLLMLAATLGSRAQVVRDTEARGSTMAEARFKPQTFRETAFLNPSDCCPSYNSRNIPCFILKDYFETSSGCARPGIIFLTKKGKHICANPSNNHVQKCMKGLKLHTQITRKPGKMDLV